MPTSTPMPMPMPTPMPTPEPTPTATPATPSDTAGGRVEGFDTPPRVALRPVVDVISADEDGLIGVDYGRGQNPTLGRVDIQIDSAERHPRDYQDWRHRDCPLTPNLAGTLNASVQAEFRNSRPSHAP